MFHNLTQLICAHLWEPEAECCGGHVEAGDYVPEGVKYGGGKAVSSVDNELITVAGVQESCLLRW